MSRMRQSRAAATLMAAKHMHRAMGEPSCRHRATRVVETTEAVGMAWMTAMW